MRNKVGFIGLGIMGLAMAVNAKSKGFDVLGYNRSPKGQARANEKGITLVPSPAELTEKSDIVVIMVTGPNDVRDVITGSQGILESTNRDGKILIQMSTIDEKATLEFSELVESRGMYFLDCPVAGSKKQVEAAELILLAGGDGKVLKKVETLLSSLGKATIHAGPQGKGTALKLCMNLIVAQMTTALCESVALAKVQGIDPRYIFDVIQESPAINSGYFQIKKNNLLDQKFDPAFSLNNMLKDVTFMDEAAKKHKLGLPVNQAVRYLMEATKAEGLGDEDLSSMLKILKPKVGVGG